MMMPTPELVDKLQRLARECGAITAALQRAMQRVDEDFHLDLVAQRLDDLRLDLDRLWLRMGRAATEQPTTSNSTPTA